MASRYALSVSLTEHLCGFIKQEVSSGRYSTASEVIRAALRQLQAEADQSVAPRPEAESAAVTPLMPSENTPVHASKSLS
jgi:antitoxin ParD1/3/4